ncbi:hypothetical protein ABEF91_003609 [Exophiala dermatitidis]
MAGKAFSCGQSGCNGEYTSKGALASHIRSQHGGRKLSCRYCPKQVADATNLRRHEKTCEKGPANAVHTKYVCAWRSCVFSGKRKDNTKRHMEACAKRPAHMGDELPEPIMVLPEGQVGGVLPDVTQWQIGEPPVLPQSQGQGEEAGAEAAGLLGFPLGGQGPVAAFAAQEPVAPLEGLQEGQHALPQFDLDALLADPELFPEESVAPLGLPEGQHALPQYFDPQQRTDAAGLLPEGQTARPQYVNPQQLLLAGGRFPGEYGTLLGNSAQGMSLYNGIPQGWAGRHPDINGRGSAFLGQGNWNLSKRFVPRLRAL